MGTKISDFSIKLMSGHWEVEGIRYSFDPVGLLGARGVVKKLLNGTYVPFCEYVVRNANGILYLNFEGIPLKRIFKIMDETDKNIIEAEMYYALEGESDEDRLSVLVTFMRV